MSRRRDRRLVLLILKRPFDGGLSTSVCSCRSSLTLPTSSTGTASTDQGNSSRRSSASSKRGGERVLAREEAAARYLRVLRNANHGFRGRADADRRRDETLLLAHDGSVPRDFALLPYVYFLGMLAEPEEVGRRLRFRTG